MRILLLVPLVVGCAAGAPRPMTPTPKPVTLNAEQQRYQFYVGRWACDAVEYTAGVAHPMKMVVRVDPVMDGTWLAVNVFVDGVQTGAELKGFDGEHRFHNLWVSPDGSSGSLSGAGWAGNTIIADDDPPSAGSRMRATFTKVDEMHYTHRVDVDDGAGYKLAFEKRCHKTAAG